MGQNHSFIRLFFVILTFLFITTYIAGTQEVITLWTLAKSISLGVLTCTALLISEYFFKKFSLRSFNIGILGLLFGYLMGFSLLLLFNTLTDIAPFTLGEETTYAIKGFLFLFAIFLGMMMTFRYASEISVSIPFVKFIAKNPHNREILLDVSTLSDGRIIDLCSTGLLDNRLVCPRFLVREISQQQEEGDKAKNALETLIKLESIPELQLRFDDTDFPEIKESSNKVLKLARFLDADVLTADMSRLQISSIEGVRIININYLSHALKPLMHRGEYLKIQIQRHGKEEKQGVGYLEDGTMVVVNGGGEFLGALISARVVSIKHTSAGRMIFCNATQELPV